MCGIAGFIGRNSGGEQIVSRMTGSIAHRGPDADGFYCNSPAFLGHRRLSIVDLATGQQPMSNEDNSVWIIYNGEIFNHSSLRPELEAAGHRYRSHCDTEAVIHSYELFGPECLQRFRGMFAFALWDNNAQTLFCARDRLGIKPFYYYWDGSVFVFASEIKALFEHPAISPEIEESLISEYLAFGYMSDERTLFRNIRKLMPGHHLTLQWQDGNPSLTIQRYWDVPEPGTPEQRDDASWIAECRQRLEETVRMRLMADVPLGMFLSGGVDSSAIAALIRRMVPGDVKTFSVGYKEAAYSELGYARQVAEAIGTDHHEVVIGMDDFFDALPRLIWHEDEPISWPSSVSLYFVSKLAAEHVKVVLTGEGSDELFAGYERYKHYQFNRRWMDRYTAVPSGIRSLVRSQIATSSLLSGSLRRKLKHTFLGLEDTLQSLQLDNFYCAFSEEEQGRMLRNGHAGGAYDRFMNIWDGAASRPTLARMLYTDQKTYLVELLMKQDQMSMACSIESRVPFLDHPFVEFAARVPDSLKIRNGEAKYIFKKAVEDLLPHDIIYRKKMGFPTPLRQWLGGKEAAPLIARLRDKEGLVARYLRLEAVDDLVQRHQSGLEDATDRLWRLLNLQIWGDVFITGNRDRWMSSYTASSIY